MALPFDEVNPVRKTYFINESERDSGTPANDEGKVPQLEDDGKLSPQFIRTKAPIVRTYENGDSPATWTKPAGLKYVVVEAVSGGQGGGKTIGSDKRGTGGDSGGYSKKLIDAASLGATETVTIGAGGAGASSSGAGADGGDSSFGSHLTASATVTPTGGDVNIEGALGAGDGDRIDPNGYGADSQFGRGGVPPGTDGNGSPGTGYGSGGGGNEQSGPSGGGNGGDGADGVVFVTEYYDY